jgi:hypothetical protein
MADGKLAVLLAGHLFLTAAPGVAVVLFAVRRGIKQAPVLLAIGLVASGLVGALGFWTFFADPLVGESFAFFALFGSILLGGWSAWGANLDRALLGRLAVPLGLWILGSAFLVFFGFLHGGTATGEATGAARFLGPLPSDSDMPKFFAEWFYLHGHHGTPPVYPGEWLFSDRPPLQAGYVLSQRPFHGDASGLDYEVLGVILQQLWIVGLWALVDAAGLRRTTRGLVMVTVLVSDLALVNGFFVWPKLLPAAFLLAAAALLLTPLWDEVRKRLWGAALVAALCGLAMLAHGSSAFGVIALAIFAVWRGIPSWRWIGVGLAVGVVLLGSWSAYQRYGDPPGNRLTKYSLAGVIEIDGRSTGEAIRDAYSEVGLGGAVERKGENFSEMLGTQRALPGLEAAFQGNLTMAIKGIREIGFFYLLPSLGLLLLGPLAMLARRRRDRDDPEWGFALRCFAVFVIGAVSWGLLLFGGVGDLTVIHSGSYLLPILAMAGAVAGLRAVLPRFATWWVLVWSGLSLALYTPVLEPMPGTSYSVLAAVMAALALSAYVALAFEVSLPMTLRWRGRSLAQTS